MNAKTITGITVVILLIIASIATSGEERERAWVPLGVVLPLTGDAASYGEHARNGVEIAKEKAAKDFGIVFDLRYEDSQIKPALAASAAQKLISVDGVQFVIGFGSGETLAMCPITEAAQRVLFSSGSSPAITGCGNYTFRNYPSDVFQGQALAKKVAERGLRNIALLYINNDYGNGLRNEFVKHFSGATPVNEGHVPQTRDFRTVVAKVKAAHPDAVVLISQMAEASRLLDQLHEQGVSVPIFGSEALKDKALFETAKPESLADLFMLFTASYNGPEASAFKRAYLARFGKEPGAFADYVHDNVLMLAKVLQNCKQKDAECVKNALYETTLIGATGRISFDSNGDVRDKPYELYRAESEEFVTEN
jgi:branched-chain amino acid transport system substrate-binding protein